jgi:hypothetical protein
MICKKHSTRQTWTRLDLLCFVDAGSRSIVVATFLWMRVPAPLFCCQMLVFCLCNAALVIDQFLALTGSHRGAVCPIPFLQCFARTAMKFSAKSSGRLLSGWM